MDTDLLSPDWRSSSWLVEPQGLDASDAAWMQQSLADSAAWPASGCWFPAERRGHLRKDTVRLFTKNGQTNLECGPRATDAVHGDFFGVRRTFTSKMAGAAWSRAAA